MPRRSLPACAEISLCVTLCVRGRAKLSNLWQTRCARRACGTHSCFPKLFASFDQHWAEKYPTHNSIPVCVNEYKRVLLLRPRHHPFTAKIKKSLQTNQLLTCKIAAKAQIRLIPSGLGGIYAIALAN